MQYIYSIFENKLLVLAQESIVCSVFSRIDYENTIKSKDSKIGMKFGYECVFIIVAFWLTSILN